MKTTTSKIAQVSSAIYELNGKPPITQAFPLGLQQLLAMFVGNIVPMLLVSGSAGLSTAQSTLLLQSSLLGAGVATLLQLFPLKLGYIQTGSGLPVMMGLTYTFYRFVFQYLSSMDWLHCSEHS